MDKKDSSVSSGTGSRGAGSLLAPSRLAPRVSSLETATSPASFILRPSALCVTASSTDEVTDSTATAPATGFKLQPPRFNNPFASPSSTSTALSETVASTSTVEGRATSETVSSSDVTGESSSQTGSDAVSDQAGGSNGRVASSETEGAHSTDDSGTTGAAGPSRSFVFGENIQDRVTNAVQCHTTDECDTENASDSEAPAASGADSASGSSKSLLEQSAEQYERRQHSGKRSLDHVTPLTGEEGERNVLTIGCKLYAFEKSSCSYRERGRGQLRLNDRLPQDDDEGGEEGYAVSARQQSRLVFRVQGSMRLALNASLWPGMDLRKPSARDISVTAMDGGQARVFLLKCAAKDADQLYSALQHRLSALRENNGVVGPGEEVEEEEEGSGGSVEETADSETESEHGQSPAKRQRVE